MDQLDHAIDGPIEISALQPLIRENPKNPMKLFDETRVKLRHACLNYFICLIHICLNLSPINYDLPDS